MWGLVAALGLVGGLVRLALAEKSREPVLRPVLQKRRLARILKTLRRRRLTRTEAEDGVVLARRLGRRELASMLEKEVRRSRKQSTSGAPKSGRGSDGSEK